MPGSAGCVNLQACANLIGSPLGHQTKDRQLAAGNCYKIFDAIGAVINQIKSSADFTIVGCTFGFFHGNQWTDTRKCPDIAALL